MLNNTVFSDQSAAALLRLVPPVLRVRDFRLYTRDSRLVDLWQYGGAAILGHTPPGILRSFKNSAERGLFAPLPHPQERRFIKALSALLPGMDFRLYSSDTALRIALSTLLPGVDPCPDNSNTAVRNILSTMLSGIDSRLNDSDAPFRHALAANGDTLFQDPALLPEPPQAESPAMPQAPILWRPFLDMPLPADRPIIPVLPLPWPGAPAVLALPSASSAALPGLPGTGTPTVQALPVTGAFPRLATQFPAPQEPLSPAILAAATRSVHDLIAASPARGRVKYPRLEQTLAKCPWQRRGIYLHHRERLDDEEWAGLFRQFLEQGFLLPPSQNQPLILPGILSAGEEAKLAGLLQ